MFSIAQEAVPAEALLKTYRGGAHPERWGRYSDCFTIIVDRDVNLSDFVFAFYTSAVFRIERLVLHALGAPSSRCGARALADGAAVGFAVWYVGERTATQLLMCDRFERTRSWFCVEPVEGCKTRLQFGSAVASGNIYGNGAALDRRFNVLLRFHVLYSQVLLHAATRNLP
jgi:hypothetical protein